MTVISNFLALCARKSYFILDVRLRTTYGVDSNKNTFHGTPKIIPIQLGVKQHLPRLSSRDTVNECRTNLQEHRARIDDLSPELSNLLCLSGSLTFTHG